MLKLQPRNNPWSVAKWITDLRKIQNHCQQRNHTSKKRGLQSLNPSLDAGFSHPLSVRELFPPRTVQVPRLILEARAGTYKMDDCVKFEILTGTALRPEFMHFHEQ